MTYKQVNRSTEPYDRSARNMNDLRKELDFQRAWTNENSSSIFFCSPLICSFVRSRSPAKELAASASSFFASFSSAAKEEEEEEEEEEACGPAAAANIVFECCSDQVGSDDVPVFASTSESLSTMADACRSASASDNSRSLSSDGLDVFGSFSTNFALFTSKALR